MTIIQDIESIVGEKGLITGKDVFNRKAGIWIDCLLYTSPSPRD